MSTPILPVEGLRAAERSSDEIGGANQATQTRQRELDSANQNNTREGGAPLLVHRLTHYQMSVPPAGQELEAA